MKIPIKTAIIVISLLFTGSAHSGFFDDIVGIVVDHDVFSLCKAIQSKDIDRIKRLIEDDPNLINSDAKICTPLHNIGHFRNVELYKAVRPAVTNINKKDKYGQTPLFHVFRNRYPNINFRRGDIEGAKQLIELFIEDGADVNAKANGGATPLSRAISAGLPELVPLLEKHGALQ